MADSVTDCQDSQINLTLAIYNKDIYIFHLHFMHLISLSYSVTL